MYWKNKLSLYIEKHRLIAIPLIIVDLTVGTFNLSQFSQVKKSFEDKQIETVVIFTKFNNALEDIGIECDKD